MAHHQTFTPEEFAGLLEYSCSIPTGTTIGKVWKCNKNAFRGERRPDWWIGRYAESQRPGRVRIIWRKAQPFEVVPARST